MGGIDFANVRKYFNTPKVLSTIDNSTALDRDYLMPAAASGMPSEKASELLSQLDRRR